MPLRRPFNTALKLALYAASLGHYAKGVRVFVYHSIDNTASPLSVSPADFRAHLSLLRRGGWHALSSAEFIARLRGAPGRAREVWLTFDDGYENFHTQAAPLLNEFGFRATVFLVTDLVGKSPLWFDRDRSVITNFLRSHTLTPAEHARLTSFMHTMAGVPLMNWARIRELQRSGIDFQSHSAAHHFLTALPPGTLRDDLLRSRHTLADKLGVAASVLCYPYGECNEAVARIAAETGFAAGVLADTTSPARTFYDISRIGVSSMFSPFHFRFTLSAAFDRYLALRHAAVRVLRRARAVLRPSPPPPTPPVAS